jgi:hypothetical protein
MTAAPGTTSAGALDPRVVEALHAEVLRAHLKHRHAPGGSLFDPRTGDLALLAALGEEVGEVSEVHEARLLAALTTAFGQVARALTYDQDGSDAAVYKELIQVGNVALTWAHRLLPVQRGKRVYVSGPISGLTAADYTARFAAGCAEVEAMGHTPINPINIPNPPGCDCPPRLHDDGREAHVWACCLRKDLAVIPTCHGIYLLRGWESSLGADLELTVARAIGCEEMYQEQAEVTVR